MCSTFSRDFLISENFDSAHDNIGVQLGVIIIEKVQMEFSIFFTIVVIDFVGLAVFTDELYSIHNFKLLLDTQGWNFQPWVFCA